MQESLRLTLYPAPAVLHLQSLRAAAQGTYLLAEPFRSRRQPFYLLADKLFPKLRDRAFPTAAVLLEKLLESCRKRVRGTPTVKLGKDPLDVGLEVVN